MCVLSTCQVWAAVELISNATAEIITEEAYIARSYEEYALIVEYLEDEVVIEVLWWV